MNTTPKFYLLVCVALGGCLDAEPGLETDEPMTDKTEQALAQSHHYSRTYGGSIFSYPFNYVTQDGDPAGLCSPGYVRPVAPVVQWTSNSGGWCAFAGWESDVHNCRARIIGGTGGGWFGGTCDTWVEELPDPGPAPTGSFSYTAANTNNATSNTTNYWISLSAGQTATLGTCGVNGASFSGDTYLRLYNPAGTEVAANDDACGLGSRLVFTATSGSSFQVRAGCYSSGSCSGTVAWTIQ